MRTIFLNTFVLTFGHGIAQLANLVFVVYFARVFGAGTFGEYSFAMAVGALLSVFVSFGTNSLAIKQISQKPDAERNLIGTLIPLQGLAGLLVIAGVLVIGGVIPMSATAFGILLIIAVYNVIAKWSGLIGTRYQGRELMAYVAGADAFQHLLRLLFGVTLIWLFNDPLAAIAMFPLCALIVFAWLLNASTRRFGPPLLSISLRRARAVMVAAWPYFSIVILTALYSRLGVILLSFIQSETAVGFFASAERLVVAAGLLQRMFVGAIFPAMTRVTAQGQLAMSVLPQRCLRLLLVFTLPAATLMYLFSADIIYLLYGTGFSQSVAVLQVVSWALVLRGMNAYLAVLAIAGDKQTELSKLKLAALILFVGLAISLIYEMSYVGLAYAIVFAEAFMVTVLYLVLRPTPYALCFFTAMWRIGVACLFLIVAGIAVAGQPIMMRVVVLPVTLFVGIVSTGAVKSHDLHFMRQIAFGSHKV